MKIVYCDLDGVLFDFNKRLNEIFPKEIPVNKETLWFTLAKYPNLYKDLELCKGASEFWVEFNRLSVEYKFDICILTAIPRRTTMPCAEDDKRKAVLKHFGNVDFKIGPYAKDKKYHARPQDILIDDKAENVIEWFSRGAIAIHHINFTNTLTGLKDLLNYVK